MIKAITTDEIMFSLFLPLGSLFRILSRNLWFLLTNRHWLSSMAFDFFHDYHDAHLVSHTRLLSRSYIPFHQKVSRSQISSNILIVTKSIEVWKFTLLFGAYLFMEFVFFPLLLLLTLIP